VTIDRGLAQTIETERFVLRPMGKLEALIVTWSWQNDPEILAGIYRRRKSRGLIHWLGHRPNPNNRTRFAFAIVPKGQRRIIGVHMLKRRGADTVNCTIGLHDRAWWGKNVVLEVRAALINHAFRNGIDRVTGRSAARNAASVFNYRRLGFTLVSTQPTEPGDDVMISGELLQFEMLRETWLKGPHAAPDLR
jgi:RimJ/RimL family protein N-acetyltransferase